MKPLGILDLITITVLLGTVSHQAFAQYGGGAPTVSSSNIYKVAITSDKTSYAIGDAITLSGTVSKYDEKRILQITIFDSTKKFILTKQISVSSDGTFSDSITNNKKLVNAGNYVLVAQYGKTQLKVEKISFTLTETPKKVTETPIQSNADSKLTSFQAELKKCADISKAYERLNCERDAKLKITEFNYAQISTVYVVGPITFYSPNVPQFEISETGQALLTVKMFVKNTGSKDNVSLMCTGPSICNYDVWNGEKAFKYAATDFTNGNIVLKPGQGREFTILFGPLIPYGGTQFIYDPVKDYVFRINEPWGNLSIPLNLP